MRGVALSAADSVIAVVADYYLLLALAIQVKKAPIPSATYYLFGWLRI